MEIPVTTRIQRSVSGKRRMRVSWLVFLVWLCAVPASAQTPVTMWAPTTGHIAGGDGHLVPQHFHGGFVPIRVIVVPVLPVFEGWRCTPADKIVAWRADFEWRFHRGQVGKVSRDPRLRCLAPFARSELSGAAHGNLRHRKSFRRLHDHRLSGSRTRFDSFRSRGRR